MSRISAAGVLSRRSSSICRCAAISSLSAGMTCSGEISVNRGSDEVSRRGLVIAVTLADGENFEP